MKKWSKQTPEAVEKIRLSLLWKPWRRLWYKVISKETLEKMSNASKWKKRHIVKHTIEAKEKMRQAHLWKTTWNKWISTDYMKWDKNPRWRWWVTPENLKIRQSIEYRLWRESVYARDHRTCQKCGDNKWWNLNPHHILNFSSYPELRFAIDNWITLCDSCHNGFHKKYGCKDNTREQLNLRMVHI